MPLLSLKVFMKYSLILLLISICLSACTDTSDRPDKEIAHNDQTDPTKSPSNTNVEPPVVEPEPYYTEAKLVAVGDIMMHLPQTQSGYDAVSKTYNFDSFFTQITPYLKGDWVIGNLETPLAGAELGYTGFPQFNAPPELADSLKLAGFNILSTTNNHALDRREKGILLTLANLRSRDLIPVGTATSQEEAEVITMVTQQDVKMAFLAYTYGTNGIPIPEGKPYLISLIDETRMKDDIKKAHELGAELVTISLHFGNEYQSQPSEEQQSLVKMLFSAGADIILGSHPHVLQPYEIVDVTTDEGIHKKGVVIYSMGNFISNQDRFLNKNKATDVGVIFEVGIRKHYPDLAVELTSVKVTPTYINKYTNNGKLQYRVLPLEALLADRNDTILKPKDYERIKPYYLEASATLESMVVASNVQLP
jgi:poly-gamma-glutamate capsule biosynthesis protein CapA/YwtB (metallophosphatase superfamily)